MDQSIWLEFGTVHVLVAGDFMLDRYIEGTVSRISPEAPVPVVAVENTREALGGAGNVVHNIVALGGYARALTCLGADREGDCIIDALQGYGADTDMIIRDPNAVTIQKTRVIASHQQFLRYDQEKITPISKECLFTIQKNERLIFEGIDVVILSDYGKGFLTKESAQFLIDAAKKRNIPVIVDPKGKDYSLYRGATVCTPNLKELKEASGTQVKSERELFEAAQQLRERNGLKNIVVTRSEEGMSLIPGFSGEKDDFPAICHEVSDVTGAGDTVISVIALGLAKGVSLPDCCKMANLAASIVVSKFGVAVATPEELLSKTLPREKLVSLESIGLIAEGLRKQGKKIVFTNGCFDLVHAGHLSSFRQAKAFGDVLIIGLNSDDSVRRLKGPSRPIVGQKNRAELLCALEQIDYVVIFDQDTPEELVKLIKPDVLVKGADWSSKQPIAGQKLVEENGGAVRFIQLEQGLSTTSIVEKIKSQ